MDFLRILLNISTWLAALLLLYIWMMLAIFPEQNILILLGLILVSLSWIYLDVFPRMVTLRKLSQGAPNMQINIGDN